MIGLYDLKISFVSLYGAQANRDFMKMVLSEDGKIRHYEHNKILKYILALLHQEFVS